MACTLHVEQEGLAFTSIKIASYVQCNIDIRTFVCKRDKIVAYFLGSLCNQCAFMCEQIAYLFSSEVTMPF